VDKKKLKVNIIKDSNGKIIATFEESDQGPNLRPKIQEHHVIEQVDLRDREDLKSLYRKNNSKY
jgi:hypothetical protein